MGKFTAAFLLVLFIQPVFAVELTADSDCDVPSNEAYPDDGFGWGAVCDGVKINGNFVCSSQGGVVGDYMEEIPPIDTSENRGRLNGYCWCKMMVPYEGAYWVYTGKHWMYDYIRDYAERSCSTSYSGLFCMFYCGRLWNATKYGYNMEYNHYGYYTDDELVMLKTALFTPVGVETPCEIGISKLMVSTGDCFSLWAEKYTEPSLVVEYNNQKCYGKLESGTGTLNIQFDGAVYHVVN